MAVVLGEGHLTSQRTLSLVAIVLVGRTSDHSGGALVSVLAPGRPIGGEWSVAGGQSSNHNSWSAGSWRQLNPFLWVQQKFWSKHSQIEWTPIFGTFFVLFWAGQGLNPSYQHYNQNVI